MSPAEQAQEPVPGDSCAGYPAGAFMTSGGPELGGTVHHLLCVGSIWMTTVSGNRCPSTGLVVWYPLNEGSGTATDDLSGNNLDGTLTSMEGDEWTGGIIDNALNFDNADDHVVIGNNALLEGFTELTLSAWVYPTNNGDDSISRIISKPDAATADDYALGYGGFANPDTIAFRITTNNGAVTAVGGSIIPQNIWSLVTGVWDGSELRTYLNTSLQATAAQTGTTDITGESLTLGSHLNDLVTRDFPGRIDEARIYNRALSVDEIQQLYNSGKGCI